jgi:hypothetical protein
MDYAAALLAPLALLIVLAAGWFMTLLSLPGNWLMVLGAALYALLVPDPWRVDVSWIAVGVVLAVAVLGEVLETLAVAMGTSRAGGSKRSALLGLCGSIGGGLVGALVGLPVPVVGSVIAVVLFAAAGATLGAYVGEAWKGRTAAASWQVGKAAFWGRLLGTMAKILAASVIVAVLLFALVLA